MLAGDYTDPPGSRNPNPNVGIDPVQSRGYDELHLLPMTSGRKSLFLQRLQLIE